MMEYIYEAFSNNFAPNMVVQIWNYLYKDVELLQLNMVLIAISTIKFYQEDLMKTKRLVDFCGVLESKKLDKMTFLTSKIDAYKEKYFSQVRGFLD